WDIAMLQYAFQAVTNMINESSVDIICLCGGKGERLRGLTHDFVPKSLFSVNGLPLLSYTLDVIPPALVARLVIAVGHHADQIKSWASKADLPYETIFSESPQGIFPAIQAAMKFCKSQTIIICNSDEIRLGLNVDEVLGFHLSNHNMATMPVTLSDHLSRHRLLRIDKERTIIESFHKPQIDDSYRGMINIGFVVIQKNAQQYFDNNGDSNWDNVINPLIRNRQLKAIPVDVHYFNVGTTSEFNEASAWLKS
ncbi:MAG: nucleotidyltransferase family protein, partial [Rhabdochlamydiaceae bacterium]